MFKFVHHVRILVHDADAMVQYMAQTFAMTPVKVQVYESRGMKNAIYQVGETNKAIPCASQAARAAVPKAI